MVPAGLPSEDEVQRLIRDWQMTPAFDGGDARVAALATDILDLIRPAFEAKEREIAYWRGGFEDQRKQRSEAAGIVKGWRSRALSAEAKLREANMQALSDEGQMQDIQSRLAAFEAREER